MSVLSSIHLAISLNLLNIYWFKLLNTPIKHKMYPMKVGKGIIYILNWSGSQSHTVTDNNDSTEIDNKSRKVKSWLRHKYNPWMHDFLRWTFTRICQIVNKIRLDEAWRKNTLGELYTVTVRKNTESLSTQVIFLPFSASLGTKYSRKVLWDCGKLTIHNIL